MSGVRAGTRLDGLERVHRRTGHEITQARHMGEVRRLAELYALQNRLEQAITAEGGALSPDGQRVRAPSLTQLRLARLGVTSLQVKSWGLEQGLITEIKRGRVPPHLVHAYAEHLDQQK